MAYSSYGAFVYRNGERRPDKEDVGVYDSDESNLPSGARIWANLMKARAAGEGGGQWFRHSHHGVMGDGPVRVACYKQGLPSGGIYFWPADTDTPTFYTAQELTATPPNPLPDMNYEDDPETWHDYFQSLWDYQYGSFTVVKAFPGLGTFTFTFTDKDHSVSHHYEATMTEPDGTEWRCVYDVEFGAGWTDEESKTQYMDAAIAAFKAQHEQHQDES